jgi:hypothetical protein
MLYDLLHLRIGDNDIPAPGSPRLVESRSLNGPRDFVLRCPKASHQLGDRRESPRYLVAAGDSPHPFASEAELLANGLKGQTTGTQLDNLLIPCFPLLRVHHLSVTYTVT